MKKTTVYLEAETDRALDRLAREQGISKAALIRRALDEAISRAGQRINAIGVAVGPGDVADNVDRHLVNSSFGDL